MPEGRIYKVIFRNQDQIFEIYVTSVSQGSLFGFIEVEQLRFGERTQVVLDPTEDQIKNEFKGVRRIFIPMHAVVRIDEVEKEGVSRISAKAKGDGNVMPFPTPVPSKPGGEPGRS